MRKVCAFIFLFTAIFIIVSFTTFKVMAAEKTINVVNFASDLPGLSNLGNAFNPFSFSVLTNVTETLLNYSDEEKKIVPNLAIEWKMLNPKEWQFKLQKGVKFHNGEDFNADAVVYNFKRILDPKTIGTNKESGVFFVFSGIEKVEKVDDYTIKFVLKYPDGMFLNRFLLFSAINAPKAVEEMGLDKYVFNPVGTGPFIFEKYEKGKEIVLKKNPNYWKKGFPKIDKLVFKIMDSSKWIDAIKSGEINLITVLDGKQIDFGLKKSINSGDLKQKTCKNARNAFWLILSENGPLKDKRVRQAINYAIDDEHMLKYLENGVGDILATTSFRGEFGHNEKLKPYPYNLEKAKSLLKEAGVDVAKGFTMKFILNEEAVPIFNYLKFQLKSKLNIDLQSNVISIEEQAKKIVGFKTANGKPNPEFDAYIHYTNSPIDHYGFTAGWQFFSKSPYALIEDKEFDKKYLEAMTNHDPVQHKKLVEEIDKMVLDNSYAIFTYNKTLNLVHSKDVSLDVCPNLGMFFNYMAQFVDIK
ncbi:MAG: ABC transporter substrate-binding protein [Oligoflexia bacterium]|nr:ABC transporter substrate-binding protein [Oligoflexia bacterium]